MLEESRTLWAGAPLAKRLTIFLSSISIIVFFGGCLNQDFERESLAKYQATRASTFVGFDPLPPKQTSGGTESKPRKMVPRNGLTVPSGRFSMPGGGRFSFPRGGRFTQPGGRFTFPAGNRYSFPEGGFRSDRTSMPSGVQSGRFSWPQQGNARFTWPKQNNSGGFTQPNGRLTFPTERNGRFTDPSEG